MNPEIQDFSGWTEANQSRLLGEIDRVRLLFSSSAAEDAAPPKHVETISKDEWGFSTPDALSQIVRVFSLSDFERDILIACAGMELITSFSEMVLHVQGTTRPYPTFGLMLAVHPDAHWSALAPASPLRYWRLIDIQTSGSLTNNPIRIDERILHYLVGVNQIDEHLFGYVRDITAQDPVLPPSHARIAGETADTWRHSPSGHRVPAVQLTGQDADSKRAIALSVCKEFDLRLYHLPLDAFTSHPVDLETLIRLMNREALIGSCAFFIDCRDRLVDDQNVAAIVKMVDEALGPVFIASPDRIPGIVRSTIHYNVAIPESGEQLFLWRGIFGDDAERMNGQLERIGAQFKLNARDMQSVREQTATVFIRHPEQADTALWEACRVQVRRRLDGLARCRTAEVAWDELVLPESQQCILREIAAHVRHRKLVYEEWGFENKSSRGLGITALFAGPSGTGKTMAAEMLAAELHLDLFHIDLSQVVSKYIGETEKNLAKVFNAAEASGAVLLFDEADALFGKRSDVKDSHDRYANIEVSYLLQRMEEYRGLAILTTNLKNAIDDAFQRRIRFIVTFPFPDFTHRIEIWKRVFPRRTPVRELQFEKLGTLNATGGMIHNIAMHAAFNAAADGESVGMHQILRATRSLYTRLEKTLTENEVRGWV